MQDLGQELTGFVITVGDEPNFRECTQRLQEQTVDFQLKIIRNVAPMSEAFNEMHRRCTTLTFVQVDEDMLLFPTALERLYSALAKAPPQVAAIVAPLWDVQVERPIYGVKIARTEVARRFPYRNVMSCEIDHNQNLNDAGFEIISLPLEWSQGECFGLHGKHYTAETAFLRWRRMFQKRRRTGRPLWAAPWPARFLDRYRRTGSEVDLFSFLGAVSAMSGEDPADREHDHRERGEDFRRIREALEVDRIGRESAREVGESARSSIGRWAILAKRWFRSRT